MNFPFKVGTKYFTAKEEAQLDKFFALFPERFVDCNCVFVNDGGEKRQIKHAFLPKGCVNVQTQYYNAKDGNRFYHTPCASKDTTTVGINYVDPDTGVRGDTDSNEWLKWAGSKWSFDSPAIREQDAGDILAAAKIKAMPSIVDSDVDFSKMDADRAGKAKKDEASWTSPTKREKPSKKGS